MVKSPPPLRTSDLGGKEKMLSGRTNTERDPEGGKREIDSFEDF